MSGVSKMRIYAALYFHSMFLNMTYEIIFAINMIGKNDYFNQN